MSATAKKPQTRRLTLDRMIGVLTLVNNVRKKA